MGRTTGRGVFGANTKRRGGGEKGSWGYVGVGVGGALGVGGRRGRRRGIRVRRMRMKERRRRQRGKSRRDIRKSGRDIRKSRREVWEGRGV